MLTVLFATYNGSSTLATCLDAFCQLDSPLGGWKLVVVDNGSTDSTGSILRSFAPRLPMQIFEEPVQGKNAALNTGLRFISGDLVVFTDDDIVPRKDWLTAIRGVADVQRGYAIFAGKILPRWEKPPPSWVLEWVPLDVSYGVTPPAFHEGEIAPHAAFGGNVAIRSCVFKDGFRFDPSIGPRGNGNYTMGSETELCLRLERAGIKAWHLEQAVVEHIVRDFQCTPQWILRRAELFGRRSYRFHDRQRFANSPKIGGAPAGLILYAMGQAAKLVQAKFGGQQRECFEARWRWHYALGEIRESRAHRPISMRQKIADNAAVCGFRYRFRTSGRARGFHILMYHRILETPDPYDFFAVALPVFEAQLAMLSRHCAVLPLSEIVDRIERQRPLPPRCVALTFDDGYRDVYTHAAPLLERYRLPALLYAAVEAIDRGFLWPDLLRYAIRTAKQSHLTLETFAESEAAEFPLATLAERLESLRGISRRLKRMGDRQKNAALGEIAEKLLGTGVESVRIPNLMLSWDELQELSRNGVDIGAHSITHPILTRTSPADCAYEVRNSAALLEAKIGKPVKHFAYPFGQPEDFSPQVRSIVETAGYRSASTAIAGKNRLSGDLFALRRTDGNRTSVWQLVKSLA